MKSTQYALRFESWINSRKLAFFIVFLLITAFFYAYASYRQLTQINTKNYWCDQESYVFYAMRLHDNPDYIGDYNRMPIYPWMLSFIYDSSMTEDDFFDRAKVFNIALSGVVLLAAFALFLRLFPKLIAINLMLLVTFTVYIFKSAYIQTEMLFFFLNFCVFLLLLQMLIKPGWRLALLTGILLGITHLTKGSVMVALGIFLFVFALRAVYLAYRARTLKPVLSQAAYALLIVVTYIAVIWPYIRTSKRVYDSYLFNLNTTIYMWYDSWADVKEGAWLYRDQEGWPPIDVPTMQTYLQQKSPADITARILDGFRVMIQRHTYRGGYGYFWYILTFLLIMVWLLIRTYRGPQRAQLRGLFSRHRFPILFIVFYFAAYTFLYAFYVPIHPGLRFMLSLYMPFLYVVMKMINLPLFGQRHFSTRFNVFLFAVLLLHTLANVGYASGVIHGGG